MSHKISLRLIGNMEYKHRVFVCNFNIYLICVIVEFDPLFQLSKILRYLYPRHPPAVQTLRSFILGWWELNIIPELHLLHLHQ